MNLERTKEIVTVNGKGKKKKAKKKSRRAAAARRLNRKRKAKGSRRARRRNPGVDLGGTVLAEVTGAVSGVVNHVAAHLSAKPLVKRGHMKTAKAVRIAAPAALGLGGGLGLGMVHPALGKGWAGGAGAVAGMHGMSVIANAGQKPSELLSKAGFALLGEADDYFIRDGQLWRTMPDKTEQLLFGVESRGRYTVELSDGQQHTVSGLGDLRSGALVVDEAGRIQLLPGASLEGLQQRTQLSGLQQRTQLSGIRDETELG